MGKKAFSRIAKIATVFTLLFSTFSNVAIASAATTTTTSATSVLADPALFVPYERNSGTIYYDPANEPGISPDEVDFTSGNDKLTGDKPSFYVYGDQDYLYFRMRILGDPYDRKGGFLSSVWNVDVLVGGKHKATVVLDGKSPHTDYLYVANPTKTQLVEVAKTDSTGSAVPNTSISNADNGHYFLDLKVPYTKLAEVVPNLDKTTPNVSFSFSTSKSANLRVINKDEMDEITAGSGAMVSLLPFGIYKPTIAFVDVTTYEAVNPTISGTTTNAANNSVVTLAVNNKSFTGTVTNGVWNIPTDLPVGTYEATATVTNEKGNSATTQQTIKVGTLISIDGPTIERVYKFPSVISGKFVNSTGGAKKVQFTIKKDVAGSVQDIITYNNIQSNSTTKKWEKTGVALPSAHGVGTYPIVAVEDTTRGSNLPTASKTIMVIAPPTITTPVLENGQLVVRGTAEPGETVEVYVDGVLYKTVVADQTGNWSIVVDKLLSTGQHPFQAKAKDDYGNEGVSSVVTYQITDISVAIANGDRTVTNDPSPTIYGKTSVTNNGKVKLTIDGGSEIIVDVINGKWKYPIPVSTPLVDGKHTVTAVAVEGGLTSSPDSQELEVDTVTDVSISNPDDLEVFDTKAITLTGTGELGGVVMLKIDEQEEIIIPLETSATWTYTPSPELPYGSYTVTVRGMDELGNTKKADGQEAKVTQAFTIVDPTNPVAEDDEVYTVKGVAKGGTLKVVDQNGPLTYSITTQPTTGTASIDAQGRWTYAPDAGSVGVVTFEVEVKNNLQKTDKAMITVHIVDLDVAIETLVPARTVDHQPTFTGTSVQTANSELRVKLVDHNERVIEEATVNADEDGRWSYRSATLLPEGDYKVIATITDATLQESKEDTLEFSIYDANYELTLTATPERIIADGMSKVELTAFLKDADIQLPPFGVANEWVTFTTEEGQFVAKEGQEVSLDGKSITTLTDSTGFATVELVTPNYYGELSPQTKQVKATVVNPSKGLEATDDFYLTFVPAYVSGKVVNALTGEPIAGAAVSVSKIFEDNSEFSYTGTTDEDGNYHFPVSRGNTAYEVNISAKIVVNGVEVPIRFTQLAEVSLGSGLDVETEKAQHVVSGKVLVLNSKTNEVNDLTSVFGNVEVVAEIENAEEGMNVTPTTSGEYVVTGGHVNETYAVIFKVKDLDSNNILAGKRVSITIPEDGKATILPILIDPYGEVTDQDTGAVISGADVNLYWADTTRNKDLGRTPHTLVELPELTGFAPGDNLNPQNTSAQGLYAWMVYPQGDYYIVASKPGYKEYSSLTEGRNVSAAEDEDSYIENGVIHVESSIVRYDFKMKKLPISVSIDGGAKVVTPDRTPVITGTGEGATNGKVSVTIKDKDGNTIETTNVLLENGMWTYPVQSVLVPAEYTVESIVVDTIHDRKATATKALVIEKVEFKIDLTATPSSVIADGQTLVTLKAVLTDKDGQPIVGETVYFNAEAGELQAAEAITDENGLATVELKAPNLYGQTNAVTKQVTAKVDNPEKGLVDEAAIAIHFTPARVTGRLMDATTQQPVAGATVTINEVIDGTPFSATVTTDENGYYEIMVPKGNHPYKLLITKEIIINGVVVPISYEQLANVGETAGLGEQFTSEKAVVGQLLMTDGKNAKPKLITDVIPGATYHAEIQNGNNDVAIDMNEHGQYMMTGGQVGQTYSVQLTIEVTDENGLKQSLAGQMIQVSIPEEGVVAVEATLIDPYGIVTDSESGEPVAGVNMQLYWADTELNEQLGRTPHTLVELPTLTGFAPNENQNPQLTNLVGEYAWMVFPDGDYYIVAEKDGYVTYDSRLEGRNEGNLETDDSYISNGIIHVGQTIVEYDLEMEKVPVTPSEPEPTPVEPEPTPVEPEPTPVEPEPTPVEPEPTPEVPVTPSEPEPTPEVPVTPSEPEPTPEKPVTPSEPMINSEEPVPTPQPVVTSAVQQTDNTVKVLPKTGSWIDQTLLSRLAALLLLMGTALHLVARRRKNS